MPTVIVRTSSYDYERLREDVFAILGSLDRGLIKEGSQVLLKPNFLAPARPGQAITTHPLVIRAAAEYALLRGARVRVSDSPAMGSFEKILAETGTTEALRGLPVTCEELGEPRRVPLRDGRLGALVLSAHALDAPVLINLPKLKTHSQMGLTLAVKNLFGCVVGFAKPEWHFRVGEDRELFAEVLVSISEVFRPAITLMDGVLAMEGAGPGTRGTPRELGLLLGSDDALALDQTVCRMLGMDPDRLLTNKVGRRMGLFSDDVSLQGALPDIRDFRIPEVQDLIFGPRFARKALRRHLSSRPRGLDELCRSCRECEKICPAHAVATAGKKKGVRFDYERCMRCYCCLEVCPYRAIARHEPLVKRFLHRVWKR
ncbi:MAG: DUF362 domain-containing protein [Nitrospirota bacterium]